MDPTQLSQSAVNVAVGGLVLALTQATKRWTPEGWGPIIAAVWTSLALVVWLVSQPGWPPERGIAFDVLSIWVAVYTSALGLYSAAMVPSSSRQAIGTGDGNVPVGETKPATRRKTAPPAATATTTAPARRVRPSRAKAKTQLPGAK